VRYDHTKGKYYFRFDVYANANNASTYFDYAQLIISYNTNAFGTWIANKIEISNGAAFNNNPYNSRETYDITSNALALCFGVGSAIPNPTRILFPITPVELFKVQIELPNGKQGVSSDIQFVVLDDYDKASVALFTETSNGIWPTDCDFYDDVDCYNPPGFSIYSVAPTLSNFTPTIFGYTRRHRRNDYN